MNKKYKLLEDETIEVFGKTLFRIQALVDIGDDVKPGDKGGYIEKEENLSHNGNAWVYDKACVYDKARIYGEARIYGAYSMFTVSNIGSVQRTTTFFVCADRLIRVSCGCFFGDLDAFRAKVRETHKDTKHAQAYLAAADFAESVLVIPDSKKEEASDAH